MGACASRPKDLDRSQEPLPKEAPESPKKAEGETVPQEKANGVETKKEEPLVDISEPAQVSPKSEAKPAELSEVKTKDKVEAAKEEEKKEVAAVAAPKPEDKSDSPLVTV